LTDEHGVTRLEAPRSQGGHGPEEVEGGLVSPIADHPTFAHWNRACKSFAVYGRVGGVDDGKVNVKIWGPGVKRGDKA